jgi:hypothetical protein
MTFFLPANVILLASYIIWRKMGKESIKFTFKNSVKIYAGMMAITSVGVFL